MANGRPFFPGLPVVGTATMEETAPTVAGPRPSRHLPDTSLTGFSAASPETTLVEELLKKYQAKPPTPPPKPSKAQMALGILGDSLRANAAARLGRASEGPGPFISHLIRKQQAYTQQLAEFEEQRQRSLESLLKIQEQQNWRESQRDRQIIQDNLRSLAETQRLGMESQRLEFERQRIEIAARNATTTEERLKYQQQLGELNLQIRQMGLDLQQQRLDFDRQIRTTSRPLPATIVTDISGAREAAEAAETALSEYERLGSPDLGFLFSATPDRFKSKAGLEARRKIAEALLPIRKYFSGTAVSEGERKEASPIIAQLEGGAAPGPLMEALRGLISMARRKERSLVRDAELAGYNTEGFQSPDVVVGPDGKLRPR